MGKFLPAIITILLLAPGLHAQPPQGYAQSGNDNIPHYVIPPARVFGSKRDERQYNRMVENLKIVYPIAKEANAILTEMESRMGKMTTERERNEFTREMERVLQRHYEPVIRKMTYSQGKLLIKLIDRETSHTTYDLVKEFRGSFRAFVWQSVARLFTANLKDTYNPYEEDWFIEELIIMLENGML